MEKDNNLQLPDFISPQKPHSFANYTVRVRFPEIIDRVIEKNNLNPPEKKKLVQLKEEVRKGKLTDPFKSNPESIDLKMFEREELRTWKKYISEHTDKSWFKVPWYFAEAFLYLRILIAFGYYNPHSRFYRVDPFKPLKEEELTTPKGGIETAINIMSLLKQAQKGKQTSEETLSELTLLSLWGNRIDLSYTHIVQEAKSNAVGERPTQLLIIDHTESLVNKLLSSEEIHFILDNAASELISDLFLIHFLLTRKENKSTPKIVLHAKKSPFFVSDATGKDIFHTVEILKQSDNPELTEFARELENLIGKNNLKIREHFFWNGPCGFPEMPPEIQNELSHSNLTILKGDANYRRLLSDREWEFSTPIEQITTYFPSDFAILRTMKSEIIAGIDPERVKKLYSEDPSWLINGKRGIVQVVEKNRG